jgi:DNA-binding LacI/PurR family transcriptional regulator
VQHGITTSTIEKVLTTLEREGLVERFHGKGIFVAQRSVITKLIGFVGRQLESPDQAPYRALYWTHIVEGIQDVAHTAGYKIMLVNPDFPMAWDENLGGIITHEPEFEDLPQLRVSTPRVCVLLPAQGFASVVADEYGGMRQAIEHLLQLGHRRIAYLSVEMYWPRQQRLMSYFDTLRRAGIVPQEQWVRTLEGLNFREQGAAAMHEWLDSNWHELGCTALLCHNDETALGVMDTLRERSVRIPDDLSLVGFDGTTLSEIAFPKLTTVEIPLREVGRRAARLLIEQIESGTSEAVSLSLPTLLKRGGSTKCLAIDPHF